VVNVDESTVPQESEEVPHVYQKKNTRTRKKGTNQSGAKI
jgi:hypothetical protein